MKLQVFIHRIYVVKDVLHYPGDDSHRVCVMEISLRQRRRSLTARHVYAPKQKHHRLFLPPWCVFFLMTSDRMQKSSRCIRPRHLQATKRIVRILKKILCLISLILFDCETFNNPLGAGVVHLFLWCIWLQNSVKHVRLSLEKTKEVAYEGEYLSVSTIYSHYVSQHSISTQSGSLICFQATIGKDSREESLRLYFPVTIPWMIKRESESMNNRRCRDNNQSCWGQMF